MVCSRYPKEYRYYESVLKRKCFKKLQNNVWENKTKWILLKKADYHYKIKLLGKCINLWFAYLNECYRKKINRRSADFHFEKKLKSKVLLALKTNLEQSWMFMRMCKRKFEWGLKNKCWHQWKHYVEKRIKVGEVKLLADRIRKERLRVRFFYLWLFRLKEKRSLQDAYDMATEKYDTKLRKKYFNLWRTFTNKQICKVKIEKLAVTCCEDKLIKRFFRCWKQYTFQKNRYRHQVKIIQKFYESYLVKNYLNQWLTVYRELKLEREICNYNIALTFYERMLLKRSFQAFLMIREIKKDKIEKMENFKYICIKIYLELWMKRRTEKIVWNSLENKANTWREIYFLETYLTKILVEYEKKVEEKEEMAKVIKYCNAIIVHRAFRGWWEVTEKKINRKAELENASRLYCKRLVRIAFDNWKNFTVKKLRKKMAADYYRFVLLFRVMDQWKIFFAERKIKKAEAADLERKYNARLLRNAYENWRNETELSKLKLNAAIDFCDKKKLSKIFNIWKKNTRTKVVRKNHFNRNKTILSDIIIKRAIFCWHEMLLIKWSVKKKIEILRTKQEKRVLKFCYNTWRKFFQKMKSVRRNVEVYPKMRSNVMIEHYLDILSEALTCKKLYIRKEKLAKRAEEKFLKKTYLRKWLSFVCWKKERILMCISEEKKFFDKENVQIFSPLLSKKRRMPLIPDYLKADFSSDQFDGILK